MYFTDELKEIVFSNDVTKRKYICGKDFKYFLLYYFSQYIKFPFADFHFEMFNNLETITEKQIRELGFIMFRESAKTSIVKAYITWCIIYKKKDFILVSSYEKENSINTIVDVINNLVANKKILSDFGQIVKLSKDKDDDKKRAKRQSVFDMENGVRIIALSTQESPRGNNNDSFRPDLIVFDDTENFKTKNSEKITLQIIAHMEEALTAGNLAELGVIYMGNYITDKGSVQWLINRSKTDTKIKVQNVPIMIDKVPTWDGKYCLTDEEAEETGKISIESIERMVAPSVFQAEFMNNPFAADGNVFSKTWFKYITSEELKNKVTRTYITIDTATSDKKGDYTGVIVNKVDSDGIWNVEAYRYRVNALDLVNNLFALYNVHKPISIGIEKTTYTLGFMNFLEQEMRKRQVFLPIVELKHGGTKKEQRIRDNLETRYASSSIKHVQGFTHELEDELLKFPHSLHDDLIDALSYQDQVVKSYKPISVSYTKVYKF
jgi:phage terminase large subunit-like protein